MGPASDLRADELPMGYASARALGMGNAFTAVVRDADGLFYNPAAIATISGFHWTVMDPKVGINGTQTLTDLQSFSGATSSNVASRISKLYGHNIWLGGNAKTSLAAPYFAAAGFVNTEAAFKVTNPAYTTLNMNYYFDYGVALGTGFDMIPGLFKVGLAARRVNRTGTTLPLGPGKLADLNTTTIQNELKSRGTGYGFDLGTLITLPGPVSPTVSFVYRNVGKTVFNHEEGAAAPPSIDSEMIVGAALLIRVPFFSLTPSFDYRYMEKSTEQTGKKINAGIEVGLPLIDIRAGIHQGYYTAGVGLNLGLLRADVATYGVEIGAYPGQLEDRRYVAQVAFEIGFDPGSLGFGGDGSGGSGGGRGGGSRLKRRR